MATPNIKLAASLEVLQEVQLTHGNAIRSNLLSRTHRERLVKHNFLIPVTKGWYLINDPRITSGETTIWYMSFWEFCKAYLEYKYDQEYHLSAEQSLLLHAGDTTIPNQLVVFAPNASNMTIPLIHGSSIYALKSRVAYEKEVDERTRLNILTKEEALINVAPIVYREKAMEVSIVLAAITDVTELLRKLLDRSHSVKAGRLVGAFEHIGNVDAALKIKKTMEAADFKIRVSNPFIEKKSSTLVLQSTSPYVNRIILMWESMRENVVDLAPEVRERLSKDNYLNQVDELYLTDAYHSLSIENYVVSAELIEKVRSGNWNLDNEQDIAHKHAMAARGYWQCFQEVKKSLTKLFDGDNAGEIFSTDHSDWYIQLFQPSVAAGILSIGDLAGYRNDQVYIKNSMHTPLSKNAVRDAMPVLVQLLKEEENAFVRSVLGHFFFVYIHPYMDGNGRMGRFLMNLMLASGGYPWTVIPFSRRDDYMATLESASVNKDIHPFAKLLSTLIQKNIDGVPEAKMILKTKN